MSDRECPDCGIQMEQTRMSAEGVGDVYVETDRDGGFLGRLGISDYAPLDAFVCPECGLTRLYADLVE